MEDKKYCVYIHTSPSNKAYIGITCQKPEKRWEHGLGYLDKHKNGEYHQPAMACAINKYPNWDMWEHIIFEDNLSEKEACKIEKLLIALFNTTNPKYGYNISSGGEVSPMAGRKHSDETKKKLSKAWETRVVSDETRKKLSLLLSGENNPMYGRHHTEEAKRKISEAHKNPSEETRKKMSDNHADFAGEKSPLFNKHHSKETREKMSKIAIERFSRPENNPMFGKHHTNETKEKISKANSKNPIFCIETGAVYCSAADAERKTGIWATSISACCRNAPRYITVGGYHWRYATEEEILHFDENMYGG